jgi:hypothetical protein
VRTSDVCPVCKKINKNTWVIAKFGSRSIKICKRCKENLNNNSDTAFHDQAKIREAEERKDNNNKILQNLHLIKDWD